MLSLVLDWQPRGRSFQVQAGLYWLNRARNLFLGSWLLLSLLGVHAFLKLMAKALAILLCSLKQSSDTESLRQRPYI